MICNPSHFHKVNENCHVHKIDENGAIACGRPIMTQMGPDRQTRDKLVRASPFTSFKVSRIMQKFSTRNLVSTQKVSIARMVVAVNVAGCDNRSISQQRSKCQSQKNRRHLWKNCVFVVVQATKLLWRRLKRPPNIDDGIVAKNHFVVLQTSKWVGTNPPNVDAAQPTQPNAFQISTPNLNKRLPESVKCPLLLRS